MTKVKNQLLQISAGIHFSERTGGVYETSKAAVEPDSQLAPGTTSGTPWARWGVDNNYPQRLIDAVMADPAASLLDRRRAMHWGKGLIFYRRIVERQGNKSVEIIDPIAEEYPSAEQEDFFFENDIENQQQGIIGDFEWWNAYPLEYILDRLGRCQELKWHRMKDTRSELRNPSTGKIDNYYLSGHWPNPTADYYSKVAAFNRMGNQSGIYKHQLVSIDKDYNPQPAWHSITRWLHIASKIPRWILANIDNSINLKYHIKIPLEYFLQRYPAESYKTENERMQAIAEGEIKLYQQIDDFLAGEKNVMKNFYSKIAVDEQGKVLPGWEITLLPNELKDEAWLRAYGTASMAITSGMGLSPSIGGQILPNGLGAGSGSDLREQFNFYMQVMTAQPRQTTLEWYKMVRRRNNWPKDIYLGYRDVILQTLDQNKSGQATQNEQSPTSPNGDNNKIQP
jgi:hypothetical protein